MSARSPWLALLAMAGAVTWSASALGGTAPRTYAVRAHAPEASIRADILSRIPLGATKDEVRRFIETRLRHTGSILDWAIDPRTRFTEADVDKLRAIGVPLKEGPADHATSEIHVQVGAYHRLLTYVQVYVYWYFDADDHVIEVATLKHEDTPS